ncbi:MAG TPA: DUF4139 domain-containing protein [Chitinophagales bacterium]|nr:DUF4139 domain-containing protein [Chitinophagales bacterium]HRG26327.1 DUF4139 domain-containing protein [Chitinophagales bacterium]HRG84216.1 DUF4139 domain-containing protein [Chitinophagales bacterium]HRH52117.1 DUF4139 domain-containing protein [Chitinophagales bacterium]
MNRLLITLLLLTGMQLHAQKQIIVDAPVEKATVFLTGAQLFHQAAVNLPKGQSEIILQGLSMSLDPNSVQGGGKGEFTILDIQYRLFYPEPKPNAVVLTETDKKIKSINDSIVELDFDLRTFYNRREVLNVQKQMMLNNTLYKGTGSDSLVLIQQSVEYYDKKLNDIYVELLQVEKKEYQLNLKRAAMVARVYELQNYRNQQAALEQPNNPIPQIIMSVQTDYALSATVEANYITYNAGWYATYDIRATDIAKPVDIAYKANVWQNSGIDWKDVKLTCSTGNPMIGNNLPEITTWYLGYYDYYYNRDEAKTITLGSVATEDMDDAKVLSDKYLNAPSAVDAGYANNYTTPVQTIANVEFDIQLKYSIPNDGKGHIVALQTKQLPTTYNYLIVPKVEQAAFLIARITDWESLNLLPGNANIYFNNTYVGKTNINPLALADTLSLSLGRDRAIEVKRTQLTDKSSERILATNAKKTMAFEIEIRNGKAIPIEVIIKDHIPVSQKESIKVELFEKDGGELDELTGIITWREKLKTKEKKDFNLEFEITYPKNEPLSLN